MHLVIPNGPDPELRELREEFDFHTVPLGSPHPTPGHWNRVLGGLIAMTEYTAYLDDDNFWLPNHLELLVAALDENPDAGFAYSQFNWCGQIKGDGRPRVTEIDASVLVHRTGLLREHGTWDPHMLADDADPYSCDGLLVERWLRRGVTFAFVPQVTMIYPKQSFGQ